MVRTKELGKESLSVPFFSNQEVINALKHSAESCSFSDSKDIYFYVRVY